MQENEYAFRYPNEIRGTAGRRRKGGRRLEDGDEPFWFAGMTDGDGNPVRRPSDADADARRQRFMEELDATPFDPDQHGVWHPGARDADGNAAPRPGRYAYRLPDRGAKNGAEAPCSDIWFWGARDAVTGELAPPPEGMPYARPDGWVGPAPWEEGGEDAMQENEYAFRYPNEIRGTAGRRRKGGRRLEDGDRPFWFWGMADEDGNAVPPPAGTPLVVPDGWTDGLPWTREPCNIRGINVMKKSYWLQAEDLPPHAIWEFGMRDADGKRVAPPANYIYTIPKARCAPGKQPASDLWFWGVKDRHTGEYAPPPPGQPCEEPYGWDGPAPWEAGGEDNMKYIGYTFVKPRNGKAGDRQNPWPFWFWGMEDETGECVPPPDDVAVAVPPGWTGDFPWQSTNIRGHKSRAIRPMKLKEDRPASPFGDSEEEEGSSVEMQTEALLSFKDIPTGRVEELQDEDDDVFGVTSPTVKPKRRVMFNPNAGLHRYEYEEESDDDVFSTEVFNRSKAGLEAHEDAYYNGEHDSDLDHIELKTENLFELDSFSDDPFLARDLTLKEILVDVGCASCIDSLDDDEMYVETPDSEYLDLSPRAANDRTVYI
eukprot:TRINITY_DN4409_c0_g1_i2.p1 TRINITY_DN4409_c0_g1~~TRINITY_DN4409_c0_g1_i2.p1  ORF type:complete len:606 (+),score=219.09 TRINITY_DN4409_c0_g1_i2:29-1819(+)